MRGIPQAYFLKKQDNQFGNQQQSDYQELTIEESVPLTRFHFLERKKWIIELGK